MSDLSRKRERQWFRKLAVGVADRCGNAVARKGRGRVAGWAAVGLTAALLALPAAAQPAAPKLSVTIGWLSEAIPEPEPLSLVEPVAKDKGLAGARLAIADNQTTGHFLGQDYTLDETVVPEGGDLAGAAAALAGKGVRLIVADLPADRLLQLADLPEMKDAVILDARAQDDRLRVSDCRANVFHTIPSRAMKADALAQYLAFKRWTRWVLVSGTLDGDKAFADAVRRAAKRYGAEIVEERTYEFQAGSRRSDTGEQQVQRQMTQLTQRLPDYDVMVVADESEVFGEYLPYRTWDARPVVGTQGLVPTSLASQPGAMGRHPDPAPLPEGRRPLDAGARLRRLGGGPRFGRGGDPHRQGRSGADPRLSGVRRLPARRLQGRAADLPALGPAAAPADPAGLAADAGLGLAAGGLPAPAHAAGHARL